MKQLILLLLIALIFGCAEKQQPLQPASKTVTLPGDDVVLARVGDKKVTQYDVEQTTMRMLGPQQAAFLDEGGNRKVLESIVMTRVMATAGEKEIDEQAKAQIERQVRDYHEQLLVKAYLKAHADPQPVTQKMVQEYYEANPERFGGTIVREYEMISVDEKLEGEQRAKMLKNLDQAKNEKDWKGFAAKLKKQHKAVNYSQGNLNQALHIKKVNDVLITLKLNQVSNPFFVDGKLYITRITKETKVAPRPLNQVSGEIRKALAPIQLKKAVKTLADSLMKTANVEYLDDTGNTSSH